MNFMVDLSMAMSGNVITGWVAPLIWGGDYCIHDYSSSSYFGEQRCRVLLQPLLRFSDSRNDADSAIYPLVI